jgi:hypothetical protein
MYLLFNERLDNNSSTQLMNYFVDKGVGRPISISIDPDNKNARLLNFAQHFKTEKLYPHISKYQDPYNNQMPTRNIELLHHVPQVHDVLITEIFPDPSPSVGLPDAEFIEIFNHSKFPINLKHWTISNPSVISALPDIDIKPDSFIILCASSNQSKFLSYGSVIALSPFPSLNNAY